MELLWQSMKLERFIQLVLRDEPCLTLQYLKRYEEFEECRQYFDITAKVAERKYKDCESINDINRLVERLDKTFADIDMYTYLCCFFRGEKPSENLLRLFGDDSGISVAFDKQVICETVSNDKRVLKCDEVNYVSDDLLDEKVEEVLKLIDDIKEDSDDVLRNEMLDLLSKYLLNKSAHFQSEREFRIIYANHPSRTVFTRAETIVIEPKSIKKIAFHQKVDGQNQLTTFFDFLSKHSKYDFNGKKANSTDPLKVYNVTPKDWCFKRL
jgi:hypothetical protein